MSNSLSGSFRTIKHDHLFMVDDEDGMIPAGNMSGMGFYYLDTRFLSRYELFVNDQPPLTLLSSTETGNLSVIVYTNNEIKAESPDRRMITIQKETVLIKRESLLKEAWFERFTLVNYNRTPLHLKLSFFVEADFRDIFEVRSLQASTDDVSRTSGMEENKLVFCYEDCEGTPLKTTIQFEHFSPVFTRHEKGGVEFYVNFLLEPYQKQEFSMTILPTYSGKKSGVIPAGFEPALNEILLSRQQWNRSVTSFESDNEAFNEILNRSHRDICMLLTDTREEGIEDEYYVAAGIPWYVALFGRDSLITARSCLILKPDLARSILNVLAKFQGKKTDTWRDEEPGKILHELRVGELARHGKIPHTPYYGSVDATCLWLILLFDYYAWTKDNATLKRLWPNALEAMAWIDRNLASNEYGYLGYHCQSSWGLSNQGWKDSFDSTMHENGTLAEAPIYLCEVQGYVYLAKTRMAQLATLIGDKDLSARLQQEARQFKTRFNRDFWLEDKKFCALALDKHGKPLRVVSSNPGHVLETGIFPESRARHVASRLMESDMFNGWGIRTLSSECVAYNPMSYHNGSIWPHDNAMIARGFTAANRPDYVEKVFTALFDVGRLMQYRRIPELFCGFSRDLESVPPVKYPVACSPQAWSAASVYSLLQSSLHLKPQLQDKALILKNPRLPSWINRLKVSNLHISGMCVTLEFRRAEKNVLVDVLERDGDLDILVEI